MTSNVLRDLYAIYGASGSGREVMPLARAQLFKTGVDPSNLVFVDDASGSEMINGHRLMTYADFMACPAMNRHAALAIADSKIRERLAARCHADGVKPWSVVAESSVQMDDVQIGEGAVLSEFVLLTSNIRIGRYFQANYYSHVAHDCVIGNFVTFAPDVRCNGNVIIEDHAYIGTGAMLRQGQPGQPLVIGRGAVVGMGAVVTRDVPAGVTVVGNPARQLQKTGK